MTEFRLFMGHPVYNVCLLFGDAAQYCTRICGLYVVDTHWTCARARAMSISSFVREINSVRGMYKKKHHTHTTKTTKVGVRLRALDLI